MIAQECKWLKDEFCVNDQCPMCADYCPVAQYPGVCKYEELVDVHYVLTPLGCFTAAISDSGIAVENSKIEAAFKRFCDLMRENGHLSDEPNDTDAPNEQPVKHSKFVPGAKVRINDVVNSGEWEMHRCDGDDTSTAIQYVSKDGLLLVEFDFGKDEGVIVLNRDNDLFQKAMKNAEFQVGQHVHVGVIGASDQWMFAGEGENDTQRYVSVDRQLYVSFRRDSDWGVIMLNQ